MDTGQPASAPGARPPTIRPEDVQSLNDLKQGLQRIHQDSGLTFRGRPRRDSQGTKSTASASEVLSPSTISGVLQGPKIPDRDTLKKFLRRAGIDEETVGRWLDARDRIARLDDRDSLNAVPVRRAKARHFGVQPCIEADGIRGIPDYIPRDIDVRLRAKMREASMAGGFLLLIGTSCTGKTRTMFEAVKDVLPDWRIWHPPGGAALRAFAEQTARQTVVWLDDIHSYLNKDRDITPDVMQRILNSGAIVASTILKSEYDRRVNKGETSRFSQDDEDSRLFRLAEVDYLPHAFGADERAEAQRRSADPRIRIALNSADYGVTQILAGGPDVVRRWEYADLDDPQQYCGWAVITAALDARRLGATAPISPESLKAAALEYLTASQRGQIPAEWLTSRHAWLDKAIAYACTPQRGAARCLKTVAVSNHGVIGYTTSDYLYHHALLVRRAVPLPAKVWSAFIEYASGKGDLNRLGRSAELRLRYRQAIDAYERAAERYNDSSAAAHAARLLYYRGDFGEASGILRPFADDEFCIKKWLAYVVAAQGASDEAIALLRDVDAADRRKFESFVGSTETFRPLFGWGYCPAHCMHSDGVKAARLLVRLLQLRGEQRAADEVKKSLQVRLANIAENLPAVKAASSQRTSVMTKNGEHSVRLPSDEYGEYSPNDGALIPMLMDRIWSGDDSAGIRLAGILDRAGRANDSITLLRQLTVRHVSGAPELLLDLLSRMRLDVELRVEVDAGTPGAADAWLDALSSGANPDLAAHGRFNIIR